MMRSLTMDAALALRLGPPPPISGLNAFIIPTREGPLHTPTVVGHLEGFREVFGRAPETDELVGDVFFRNSAPIVIVRVVDTTAEERAKAEQALAARADLHLQSIAHFTERP